MQEIFRDLRYGVRMLRKNLGVSLIAIITLSLGIGATVPIFSIINGFFFRPLNYKEPDRLVVLRSINLKQGGAPRSTSLITFNDWKDSSQSFEHMAGVKENSFNLSYDNNVERIQGAFVTSNFFQTVGVEPFSGRVFRSEDSNSGFEQVVVLHYKLWQRSFGGKQNIIGKIIKLNSVPYTVIGVMPEKFDSYEFAELWTPINSQLNSGIAEEEQNSLDIIARLKRDVRLSQAQNEMTLVTNRLNANSTSDNDKTGIQIIPFRESLVEDGGSVLPILMGAVIFVLLIACSNVANLLLSQATTRQKEVALRAALGASRARLIRQLLIESILLTLISSAFGTLLAYWAINAIVAAIPVPTPLWLNMSIDLQVLVVTLLTAVLIGILLGLVPALRVSQPILVEWLKESSQRSGSYFGNKLRNIFIISETALAVILLSTAGLLTQSFIKLSNSDLGYNPQNLITMDAELPELKYQEITQIANFSDQVLERLRKVAGVQTAAISTPMGFISEGGGENGFTVEGKSLGGRDDAISHSAVTPEYVRTMGLELLTGRGFTDVDIKQRSGVAIVNQYLAQRYWAGGNAIGKQIRIGGGENAAWLQVIGVVEDAHVPGFFARGAGTRTHPQIYLPYTQRSYRKLTILARTTSEPLSIAPAMRNAVLAVDPEQPVHNIKSGEQTLYQSIWFLHAFSFLLRIFALLGIVFVAVGLYGVISFSVEQRRNEISIRIALGAQSNSILKMISWHGVRLVLIGIAIGLPMTWLFAQVISVLMFNMSVVDPLISIFALLVLIIVALIASLVPVRRAIKIEPVDALRHE